MSGGQWFHAPSPVPFKRPTHVTTEPAVPFPSSSSRTGQSDKSIIKVQSKGGDSARRVEYRVAERAETVHKIGYGVHDELRLQVL